MTSPAVRTTPGFDELLRSCQDPLVGAADGFFDRFYFNLHGSELDPLVLIGAGYHPHRGVLDGYLVAVTGAEQRNIRFSDEVGHTHVGQLGPLSWNTPEPGRWELAIGANPSGVELDVTWVARAPAWEVEPIVVDNGRGESSDFRHYFQSGRYSGTLRIDGVEQRVDGWFGQRDRSRGHRAVGGGQGFHVWVQSQFPDRNIAFLYDADRSGNPRYCDGAVLSEDGDADPIVEVRHDLRFDDVELRGGRLRIRTAAGQTMLLDAELPLHGGGYLEGGGYGGWHGGRRGRDHVEHETWALDGTRTARDMRTPITDRLARFTLDEAVSGTGVLEFSRSRSSKAVYRPDLDAAQA